MSSRSSMLPVPTILALAAASVLPLVATACDGAALEDSYIKGAVADPDTSYPAVVRIDATWPDGSRSLCSGTLIGPRTVVTAAHCVYDDCATCSGTRCQSAKAVTLGVTVTVGGDLKSDGAHYDVGRWSFDPMYRDDFFGVEHDVAVLTLTSPEGQVTSFPPLQPKSEAIDWDFRGSGGLVGSSTLNVPVDLVGFGDTLGSPEPAALPGQDDKHPNPCADGVAADPPTRPKSPITTYDHRRRATNNIDSSFLGFWFKIDETGEGSICPGDSGGAAFDPATGELVGINTRGSYACDDGYAVPVGEVADFITQRSVDHACGGAGNGKFAPVSGYCAPSCGQLGEDLGTEVLAISPEGYAANVPWRLRCANDASQGAALAASWNWARLDSPAQPAYDCTQGCFMFLR